MEGVNVFDRNGREIKLGDRVRISAEECNKFMHDWYAEAWIPEMHCAHDDFGTVVIQDGFAQIVNEHGDMLIDLSLDEGCQSNMYEVVSADRGFHKQVVGGEELLVANTLEDAFISWFGEEGGKFLSESLSQFKEADKKCVYILKIHDHKIKIGVTKNFTQRRHTVSTSSGENICDWCHTDYLPKRAAFEIENACHAAFKHQRIKGEFFDVDFKTACDKLATYSPITNCCTQVACHEY